jgi:signal transduction histidine kinase
VILDRALVARVESLVGMVRALDVTTADEELADDLARVAQAGELLADELARLRADTDVSARQVRHDLRNPLSAVIGYADLLLDDPAVGRIGAVRDAAVSLLELLEGS